MRNSRLVWFCNLPQAGRQGFTPVTLKPIPSLAHASRTHEVPPLGPAPRVRVADRVFEELLGAILRGELVPGEPVPTQRALSREFGVSPLVVRQAIHRLEELQLVRVRQGSSTIVLDPKRAADVRLIQLQLEAAKPGDALALAGIENRAASGLPMLMLAARRMTEAELDALDRLVEGLPTEPTAQELSAFQSEYWSQVAKSTRNPLIQQQVRWWFSALPGLRVSTTAPAASVPGSFYRDVNAALRKRVGIIETWLAILSNLCEWLEAQPGHAIHGTQTSTAPAITKFTRPVPPAAPRPSARAARPIPKSEPSAD